MDFVLLLAGLALVSVSIVNLTTQNTRSSGSYIGFFDLISKNVKSRSPLQLFWSSSADGDKVSDSQLVFTGEESLARIKLNDGNEITVKENSLIKINKKKLDIVQGQLAAQINDGEISIAVDGEEITIKSDNAVVNLQKTEGKTTLALDSGSADVTSSVGEAVKITTNEIVTLKKEQIETKELYQFDVKPLPRSTFLTPDTQMDVEFSEVPGELIISESADFKRPKRFNEKTLALKPGRYYWQIVDANRESPIFYFDIFKDTPPELTKPTDGEHIEVSYLPTQLVLQWNQPDQSVYELEVDTGRDVYKFESSNGLKRINFPAASDYRWRARKKSETLNYTWSEWSNFKLTQFIDQVPTDLSPKNKTINTFDLSREVVTFSWKTAGKVEIEITGNNFNYQEVVQGFRWEWKNIREGVFNFRARSVSPRGLKGEWSETATIVVKDLSKVREYTRRSIPISRPGEQIKLSWEANSDEYRFELATDASFNEVIYEATSSTSEVSMEAPGLGEYYWRYHYKDENKWRQSLPEILELVPRKELSKPKTPKKLKVPLNVETPKRTFFNSAWAQSGGSVSLAFPKEEDVKEYRLVIYEDEKQSKIVFDKKQKSHKFSWKNARPGVYYFQYYHIDFFDRESPPSELAILEVSAEHLRPDEIKNLKLKVKSQDKVEISWKKDKKSSFYLLEVAHDKDFSNPQKYTLTDEEFVLKVEPNKYFIRLRAVNDFGEGQDVQRNFVIKKVEPKPVVPSSHTFFVLYRPTSNHIHYYLDEYSGKVDGQSLTSIQLRYEYLKEYYFLATVDFSKAKVFIHQNFEQKMFNFTWGKSFKDYKVKYLLGVTGGVNDTSEFRLEMYSNGAFVETENKTHPFYGVHGRAFLPISWGEFHFDQYLYFSDWSGFDSQLSFRKQFGHISIYAGAGLQKLDGPRQKRDTTYFNIGLGYKF